MKVSSHYFEIKDLLIQFLAAFDDVIIKRYDKNRVPGATQEVRYIYAPKQRVLFDLINPGQNLVLPVVSVTIGSIQRDNNRVFNKNAGFFAPGTPFENSPGPVTFYYKAPVPINIEVKMSIISRYQSDMDQILSNFVPFNNPYIILSWTVPKEFNLPYTQEIRSEVLWSGNVNMSYPTDINGNQKAQIIADTSFTIKGWLFPDPVAPAKNIYKIDTFFTAVSTGTDTSYGSYTYLKANAITSDSTTLSSFANTEVVTVSGRPIMSSLKLYTPLGGP